MSEADAAKPARRRRSLSPATRARRGLLPHQPAVTLHVAGTITTERDLLEALQRRMPGPGGLGASLKP